MRCARKSSKRAISSSRPTTCSRTCTPSSSRWAALERENSAFRHQDGQNTSVQLGRSVELDGKSAEPNTWYHLGQARIQTKEFAGAVVPLENYLKSAGTGKTAQYAGFLLGQAY